MTIQLLFRADSASNATWRRIGRHVLRRTATAAVAMASMALSSCATFDEEKICPQPDCRPIPDQKACGKIRDEINAAPSPTSAVDILGVVYRIYARGYMFCNEFYDNDILSVIFNSKKITAWRRESGSMSFNVHGMEKYFGSLDVGEYKYSGGAITGFEKQNDKHIYVIEISMHIILDMSPHFLDVQSYFGRDWKQIPSPAAIHHPVAPYHPATDLFGNMTIAYERNTKNLASRIDVRLGPDGRIKDMNISANRSE